MQPRIERSVVLPLPEGPIKSVSSPWTRNRFAPLSASNLRGALAELLHSIFGFEDEVVVIC